MNSGVREHSIRLRDEERDLNGSRRVADTDLVSSATNVKLEQMRFYEFLNRGSNQGFQAREILIARRIKTAYETRLSH